MERFNRGETISDNRRILIVDDNPKVINALRRMLHKRLDHWDVQLVQDPLEAERMVASGDRFDVVVLDVNMPVKGGLELLEQWKCGRGRRDFEVIMLTGEKDATLKAKSLDMGAADLLNKPVKAVDLMARLESVLRMKAYRDAMELHSTKLEEVNRQLRSEIEHRLRAERELEEANQELQRKNRRLEELATHDELTELHNRRSFVEKLAEYSMLADRLHQPLSCIMGDLDHFKLVNDAHGHLAGDAVLVEVARALRLGVRRTDIVSRYGGEEFAVLLPNTHLESAVKLAEKLKTVVAGLEIGYEELTLHITISMGVAAESDAERLGDKLVREADQALYRAKQRGRNRVETL